uniref:(2Fe-2S)-binding protein n=1 Tax=Marinobacterium profundum TaxID=1714300 RepID=UPI0008374557|nr:(2Fe-2S)-binding protein [Marinobacterium profundum]
MPGASKFERLAYASNDWIQVTVEGQPVQVRPGDSAAAALLAAGQPAARTSAVSGDPRAPYCLMGICFECLLEIDGVPNVQGCMVQVADGMNIRRQQGAPVLNDSLAEGVPA